MSRIQFKDIFWKYVGPNRDLADEYTWGRGFIWITLRWESWKPCQKSVSYSVIHCESVGIWLFAVLYCRKYHTTYINPCHIKNNSWETDKETHKCPTVPQNWTQCLSRKGFQAKKFIKISLHVHLTSVLILWKPLPSGLRFNDQKNQKNKQTMN